MTDTSVINWLQQFSSPLLDGIFKAITLLGNAEYYILVIPLLFWLYDKKFALRFGIFFLGNAWLNSAVKHVFRVVRPPIELHKIVQGGYSFPSGHAQGSAGFWGYLSLQLKRKWAYGFAVLLITLVSLSRLYLGVHFPLDIVGGIGLAAVWLGVYEFISQRANVVLNRWQWYVGSLAVSALLLLIHPQGDSPLLAGFTLSSLWGYRLEREWVAFNVKASWWQNAVKIALGLGVLMALHSGLKPILAGLFGRPLAGTAFANAATFTRYFIMGWWVTLLAPLCFRALGLAKQD